MLVSNHKPCNHNATTRLSNINYFFFPQLVKEENFEFLYEHDQLNQSREAKKCFQGYKVHLQYKRERTHALEVTEVRGLENFGLADSDEKGLPTMSESNYNV